LQSTVSSHTYSTPCSPVCGLQGCLRGQYRLNSVWAGGWGVWVPPTATARTPDSAGAVQCDGVVVGAHWGVKAHSHHKHGTLAVCTRRASIRGPHKVAAWQRPQPADLGPRGHARARISVTAPLIRQLDNGPDRPSRARSGARCSPAWRAGPAGEGSAAAALMQACLHWPTRG